MKYFLVVRNMKKENETVLEFNRWEELKEKQAEMEKSGHKGELVPCHGSSMRDLLNTFTEYRPKNWRQLLSQH